MIQNPENPWAKESFVCECQGHHLVMNYFPKEKGKNTIVETSEGVFSRESLYIHLNIPHGSRRLWDRIVLAWKVLRDYTMCIEEVELIGADVDRFLNFQKDVLEVRKLEQEKSN